MTLRGWLGVKHQVYVCNVCMYGMYVYMYMYLLPYLPIYLPTYLLDLKQSINQSINQPIYLSSYLYSHPPVSTRWIKPAPIPSPTSVLHALQHRSVRAVCLFSKCRPDMTFAVDWALSNNDLSICSLTSTPSPKLHILLTCVFVIGVGKAEVWEGGRGEWLDFCVRGTTGMLREVLQWCWFWILISSEYRSKCMCVRLCVCVCVCYLFACLFMSVCLFVCLCVCFRRSVAFDQLFFD